MADPVNVLPSGGVNVNDAVAKLLSCWGVGNEDRITANVTVAVTPAATFPTGIPVTGEVPG
ncbi:hypothetical protein D3C73_1549650 [compost metagenome]